MQTLFVGLDSGKIHQFRIPKEHNYMRFSEVITQVYLNLLVIGRSVENALEKSNGLSCGKASRLCVFNQ